MPSQEGEPPGVSLIKVIDWEDHLWEYFCRSGDVKSLQSKREKARRKAESFRAGGRYDC